MLLGLVALGLFAVISIVTVIYIHKKQKDNNK